MFHLNQRRVSMVVENNLRNPVMLNKTIQHRLLFYKWEREFRSKSKHQNYTVHCPWRTQCIAAKRFGISIIVFFFSRLIDPYPPGSLSLPVFEMFLYKWKQISRRVNQQTELVLPEAPSVPLKHKTTKGEQLSVILFSPRKLLYKVELFFWRVKTN